MRFTFTAAVWTWLRDPLKTRKSHKFEVLNMPDDQFAERLVNDHHSLAVNGMTVRADVVLANLEEFRRAVRDFPEPELADYAQVPVLSGIVLLIRLLLERA